MMGGRWGWSPRTWSPGPPGRSWAAGRAGRGHRLRRPPDPPVRPHHARRPGHRGGPRGLRQRRGARRGAADRLREPARVALPPRRGRRPGRCLPAGPGRPGRRQGRPRQHRRPSAAVCHLHRSRLRPGACLPGAARQAAPLSAPRPGQALAPWPPGRLLGPPPPRRPRPGLAAVPGLLDAQGLVLGNALAPELWRRTTISCAGRWPPRPAAPRPGSVGPSGSPSSRWPRTRPAGPSTSMPSSAWTPLHPKTTPTRSRRSRRRSPSTCSPRPSRPPPPKPPCSARPWVRPAEGGPLGRPARPAHHRPGRPGRAVGRGRHRLHRQVRHQGHRELRRRPGPPHPPRARARASAGPGPHRPAGPGRLAPGRRARPDRAAAAPVDPHARLRGHWSTKRRR
jgi:hypothetical protein